MIGGNLMRKIFAYIVTLLTIMMSVALCVASIIETTNFAMEYTGGFEVLYKSTSSMKDVKDSKVADTISAGMNKILDINGVKDAVITVEDGHYIRANVTSNNQIISDEIRDLIQNPDSIEITFRDAENNELAKGKDILETARRELKEETGLDIAELESCGVIHWCNKDTSDRYIVFCYIILRNVILR